MAREQSKNEQKSAGDEALSADAGQEDTEATSAEVPVLPQEPAEDADDAKSAIATATATPATDSPTGSSDDQKESSAQVGSAALVR